MIIKETKDTPESVSCLDLHLELHNKESLHTTLYDKYDEFNIPMVNIPMVNFPFIGSTMYSATVVWFMYLVAHTFVKIMCKIQRFSTQSHPLWSMTRLSVL